MVQTCLNELLLQWHIQACAALVEMYGTKHGFVKKCQCNSSYWGKYLFS